MENKETLSLIIQGFVAIGTILAALIAIFHEWFKTKLTPPKLSLELCNDSDLNEWKGGTINTGRVLFYHLKVINHKKNIPARNCAVLLKEISHQLPNGKFQRKQFNYPLQLKWAPGNDMPLLITVNKVSPQTVDFGYLNENSDKFTLSLVWTPYNFDGYVLADKPIRFYFQVVADNYVSSKLDGIQVSWNGRWSENPTIMNRNLIIEKIKE